MVDSMVAWLSSALERSGMTQAALADAMTERMRATIDRSKVNKMMLGKRTISAEEMLAIAEITGAPLPSSQVINRPGVAVAGRVGAGAKIPLFDGFEKGDGLYHVACPPQIAPTGVVAVEVEGDSMSPMYQPGHVLFFTRHTHEGVLEEDIGKPCVVEDEAGNAWVKLVKRGSAPGLWNLVSLNPSAESAWDVRIKWAARVRMALPADVIERI